jgi:hypothetical protein
MKIGNKIALHKKALLIALADALGNVTTACKVSGVSRSNYYSWVRPEGKSYDPIFAGAVNDITEATIDHVEDKLHELIDGVEIYRTNKDGTKRIYGQAPDTGAICFFLKCRAKHRGYVERQEITGPGGGAIQHEHYAGSLAKVYGGKD